MNEEQLFVKKWKDKYPIDWCYLCDTAIVICPVCKNSSCNGGGCSECLKDYKEWRTVKRCVEDYLTQEEIAVYEKCLRLRHFILESIAQNDPEINWKKMREEGDLSRMDEEIFVSFV